MTWALNFHIASSTALETAVGSDASIVDLMVNSILGCNCFIIDGTKSFMTPGSKKPFLIRSGSEYVFLGS